MRLGIFYRCSIFNILIIRASIFLTGICSALCGMFYKTASRINPQTNRLSIYYRLVENGRDVPGIIRQRNIMAVGFMDEVNTEELHCISNRLNDHIAGQGCLLEDSEKVRSYVEHLHKKDVYVSMKWEKSASCS